MNEKRRNFADIESDLLKAQANYADANKRLEAALQERAEALASINAYQEEFDTGISSLRKSSVPGTRWHDGSGDHELELVLGTEHEVNRCKATILADDEPDMEEATAREPAEVHFAHLRTIVEANSYVFEDEEEIKSNVGPVKANAPD